MNYWLHRISHHAEVSYPLLSNNLLSIGFSNFAYPTFIDDVLRGGWPAIENAFKTRWGVPLARSRYSLCRFIYDMKKGDIVVVPSAGTFSVYRIVDNRPQRMGEMSVNNISDWSGNKISSNGNLLLNKHGKEIDLGFFRMVEPIEINISRGKFADAALTARMKVRTTNSKISDLKKSIENAIEAYRQKKPINLHSQILEESVPTILKRLKSQLNPDKFENLVKWYFQRVGASETYIPSKNEREKEGDADVVATFEGIKTIFYTQVKFHEGQTDEWAAEQIKTYKENKEGKEDKEVMDDGYSKIAWVVSSANSFSDHSQKLAKENRIQLIDGPKFVQMLLDVGLMNLDKAL